jgi:hypothetical protein
LLLHGEDPHSNLGQGTQAILSEDVRRFLHSLRAKAYITLNRREAVPVHAMKAHKENKDIAPLILNLSTSWR